GERQRVALARALAPRPSVLLLDEPLSALDARTRRDAARELASVLGEASVPSVLVTHDFTEAALLGDRVAVMDGGRIAQEGPAALDRRGHRPGRRPPAPGAGPARPRVVEGHGDALGAAGVAPPRPPDRRGAVEICLSRSGWSIICP